ncbi:MAG: MinD/ParA family protein [bacterium]|nr:MinD/ParA family protein [bacterium]
MEKKHKKQYEIWAVGGGKGGTGKTFVICQLATCLAAKGKRVVLIDADFGGANVHTFFGVPKTNRFLTNFFDNKEKLENLMVETDVKNLAIIPGNRNAVAPANIKYAQKVKLFRHIKHLDADYILLDLGGGTTTDTIDSFLLADKLIVVAVPEVTAIENLYQFIKTTYFRRLKSVLSSHGIKNMARDIWQKRTDYGIKTIVDLLDYMKAISPEVNDILTKEVKDFSLNIILNKVRNVREVQEGFSVRSVCIKYIGVDARYSGYVEYDYQFWRNLSLIQAAPRFLASHSMQNDALKIANNIMNDDQLKIDSLKHV